MNSHASQHDVVPGLVTTIIPVYNRAAPLRRAVESVLAQDYRPIEVIVVDDGSTQPDTASCLTQLGDAHPELISVVRLHNGGPGAAREQGRLRARGEFIQYLDSDDVLLPGKFSAQVAGLRGDAGAGISYGLSLDEERGTGRRTVTHGTDVPHRTIFPAVLQGRLWPTMSPLYRRSVTDAIGPWSSQRILEDWDYECRAGLLGTQLHYCPQAVAMVCDEGDAHAGLSWQADTQAMRDRVATYVRVVSYGQQAGVARESAPMQSLVRTVFWMARVAGARGLAPEAQALFQLARSHAVTPGWDYAVFGAAARALGWQRASKAAHRLERLL
jgi:glycosyltransferase involved in cell wall biosynthesis